MDSASDARAGGGDSASDARAGSGDSRLLDLQRNRTFVAYILAPAAVAPAAAPGPWSLVLDTLDTGNPDCAVRRAAFDEWYGPAPWSEHQLELYRKVVQARTEHRLDPWDLQFSKNKVVVAEGLLCSSRQA